MGLEAQKKCVKGGKKNVLSGLRIQGGLRRAGILPEVQRQAQRPRARGTPPCRRGGKHGQDPLITPSGPGCRAHAEVRRSTHGFRPRGAHGSAESENILEILTLDADFAIYRAKRARRLKRMAKKKPPEIPGGPIFIRNNCYHLISSKYKIPFQAGAPGGRVSETPKPRMQSRLPLTDLPRHR